MRYVLYRIRSPNLEDKYFFAHTFQEAMHKCMMLPGGVKYFSAINATEHCSQSSFAEG